MSDSLPDLSDFFKAGLLRAVQSYNTFKDEQPPSESKEFTTYHNACKAALLHIALLMKLLQNTQPSEDVTNQDWIVSARAALNDETEENDDLFSA